MEYIMLYDLHSDGRHKDFPCTSDITLKCYYCPHFYKQEAKSMPCKIY